MFAEMFHQLGDMPSPIANSEYRARQNKLYQTLQDGDLLIICASPETIIQMMSTNFQDSE